MPEDKQKEESMIDVGEQEGAEINLDEQSKGTENETQETKIEVADDNQPANTSEKSDRQSDASAQNNQKEELEKYSDSVKKRINGLTKRMREAERQREEALTFARTMKEQKEKAENRFAHLDKSYMSEFEKRVTSNLDAAKSELKNAIDNGDAEGQVAAQQKIAQLTMDAARLSTLKASQPQEKEGKQVNINPQRTEARSNVQTDPKAEVWASKNTWFGNDSAMTYTAFDIHKKLVEEEGFDPKSDDYYEEIDKRIRLEFPHKFDTTEDTTEKVVQEQRKPAQTVASARRPATTGRAKTVKLTPSQVAIAKKLGVPLEDYARQLQLTKEV
tara:strand:+ start:139 stop:1128 length:990 start_codon:yes stop_codon:yes gene_type:complete